MAFEKYRREDYNALDDAEFRALVRAFLEENHPPELRNPPKRLHWDEARPWYMKMSAAGWLSPAWPTRHGGMGLLPAKQLIYMEEFENFGAARCPDHGIMLLGPLLIDYGSEEQKARFLPRILAGEDIWCQGYSEPDAGSDLASLRTEAVLDGNEWVVNGQKVWTTLAGDADWMFALVRTDKSAKKQEGISFLLIPMQSPGVTVRPIINIDLQDEFSEVFLDNVRVPRENLVGEVNQGWTMAKNLLGFERVFLGSPRQSSRALAMVARLARHYGILEDSEFVKSFTDFRLELADHECLFEQITDRLRRGESLGADLSLLKLHQTDLFQRITNFGLELCGADGGFLEPIDGDRSLNAAGLFLAARAATIYGGSSEVQRNIVAKTLLQSA